MRGPLDASPLAAQDMDAVYEELDQKVYEKNVLALEDHLAKLSRGVVKLSQVHAGRAPGKSKRRRKDSPRSL